MYVLFTAQILLRARVHGLSLTQPPTHLHTFRKDLRCTHPEAACPISAAAAAAAVTAVVGAAVAAGVAAGVAGGVAGGVGGGVGGGAGGELVGCWGRSRCWCWGGWGCWGRSTVSIDSTSADDQRCCPYRRRRRVRVNGCFQRWHGVVESGRHHALYVREILSPPGQCYALSHQICG